MSEMNALSYRNALEDLLRKAEDDGYKFAVDVDIAGSHAEDVGVDLEFYFMGKIPRDHATVSGDLIWEFEV